MNDEYAATLEKYQSDIDKLRSAIIDHPDVPGGFMETVVTHIRAMRCGIAQLVVTNAITLTRAVEMTGLSLMQVRQWAKSGRMQQDALPYQQAAAINGKRGGRPPKANNPPAA